MKTTTLFFALLATCVCAQDATNTVAVSDSDTTLTAIACPAEAAPTNTLALVRLKPSDAIYDKLLEIKRITGNTNCLNVLATNWCTLVLKPGAQELIDRKRREAAMRTLTATPTQLQQIQNILGIE